MYIERLITNFCSSFVAIGFRLAKKYEKAKEAFEKASKGQEMQASYPHFSFKGLAHLLGIICLLY